MTQQFWQRWSQYLQRLQNVSKWRLSTNSIKIGTLVFLIDERYLPAKWLARVIQTHPGDDGLVRVVTVRTSNSEFKRPIVKLCPLPISE